MNLLDLAVKISVDDQASGKVGSIGSGIESKMGKAGSAVSAFGVAFGNIISNVAGAAWSKFISGIEGGVARVDILNQFNNSMVALGESTDAAKESVNAIKKGLDGLPSRTADIASFVGQIKATGPSLDQATSMGLAFNDAMLAGGKGTEVAARASEAFTKALAKGKFEADNWFSLVEAAPAQMNQLAESVLGAGATYQDLKGALDDGSVSMEDFNDALVNMGDSFHEQAQAATKGIGTSIENLQSRINNAWAGIIDALDPSAIAGAIDAVSSQFGKLGKILGGMETGEDGEEYAVGFIAGIKRGFESGMDGWEPSFSIDFAGIVEGVQQAAEAIGEFLGGPIASFIQTFDGFMSKIQEASATAAEMFSGLDLPDIDWQAISDGVSAFIEAWGGFAGDVYANAIVTIADVLSQLASIIGENVMPVVEAMKPNFEAVVSAIQGFFQPIADFMTGNGPAFQGMMERIGEHLEDLQPALDDLSTAWASLMDTLQPVYEALAPIGEFLGGVFAEVLGNIGSVIVGLLPIVVEGITGIINTVNGFWQAVMTAGNVITGVFNTIGKGIEIVVGFFTNMGTTIQSIWTGVTSFIASIPGSIVGFFTSLPGQISNVFGNVKDGITNAFDAAVSFISGIPGQVIGFFSGIGGWLFDSGKSLIEGFVNGIKQKFEGAKNVVSDGLGKLRDLFPFSPAKEGPFSGRGWVLYSGMSIMDAMAEGASRRARHTVAAFSVIAGQLSDALDVSAPALSFRRPLAVAGGAGGNWGDSRLAAPPAQAAFAGYSRIHPTDIDALVRAVGRAARSPQIHISAEARYDTADPAAALARDIADSLESILDMEA